MRRLVVPWICAALAGPLAAPRAAAAQQWDSPAARALVDRAVARRAEAFADTTLRDFSARAHGFVFFLGQLGEGLAEPPRLVKADQLELEVYWRAPNRSKQRIVGWRDRPYMPTDIAYHRDHLGIVMNNFADIIRLGEGDEVRDVPHPISPRGAALYEFALVDSLEIRLPDRAIRVHELRVRPRQFAGPRLVGSVYVDVTYGDLVRMTFNFTRAAYRDEQLEDISVAIENSLWGGRFWLPLRQEIEIRRRATWMDFPARGIIRGRWEIDGYRFNEGLADSLFAPGPEIVAAPAAARAAFPWPDALDAAVRDIAGPERMIDFAAIRAQAIAVAQGHVLTRLRRTQPGAASLSDLVRVNRVEGVALGLGVTRRSADQAVELKLLGGVATAPGLVTGAASLAARRGAVTWQVAVAREVREMGDAPVISRAMNSLAAQELGADYGDYYLAAGGEAAATRALGGRTTLRVAAGWQRVDSLLTRYRWSRGAFRRANPGADAGAYTTGRIALRRQAGSFATERELSGRADIEVAGGAREYVRGYGELRWLLPAGATHVVWRASAGAATRGLPRQRAFVLGGRGTLLGEPFRSRAGRVAAWSQLEWRVPVAAPEIPLGSYGGTGRTATLAPWVAAGWTGEPVAGHPAPASRGVDAAAGLGLGLLHDLIRVDVGVGLRSGRVQGAFDVGRVFWDIL
jgi:hypothetical protein